MEGHRASADLLPRDLKHCCIRATFTLKVLVWLHTPCVSLSVLCFVSERPEAPEFLNTVFSVNSPIGQGQHFLLPEGISGHKTQDKPLPVEKLLVNTPRPDAATAPRAQPAARAWWVRHSWSLRAVLPPPSSFCSPSARVNKVGTPRSTGFPDWTLTRTHFALEQSLNGRAFRLI